MSRRPRRSDRMAWRTVAAGLCGALVTSALAWYLGTDVWHAIVIGAVAAALIQIAGLVDTGPDVLPGDWPDEDRRRPGARTDVADLSRSIRAGRGRAGETAVRHARGIAERRLAAHRLDLRATGDRPAIEELIGSGPYATLTRGRPTLRALERCLDALETLQVAAPGAGWTDRR